MTTLAEENKKLVVDFYSRLFNDKDITQIDKHIVPDYIQHSPTSGDGREGVRASVENAFRKNPQRHYEIKRVIADGDLVVLHVHQRLTPEHRGNAIVEIIRVEDGRLVEHWSVHEAVPETSMNSNGMF